MGGVGCGIEKNGETIYYLTVKHYGRDHGCDKHAKRAMAINMEASEHGAVESATGSCVCERPPETMFGSAGPTGRWNGSA